MPAPTPRQNLSTLTTRVDDHESRIDALEMRLAKYDVILERLNVLIDVLSDNMKSLNDKAGQAIEGQEIIKERNEGAHRWATIGITVGTSIVVGVLCFVVGYVLPH